MAKRAGSEDGGAKVGPKGAGAPAPDENQVVTQESFRDAVKRMAAADQVCAAANKARSTLRKTLRGSGIVLGAMDKNMKMADWSRGEVRDQFATERQYAEWLGLPVGPAPAMKNEFEGMDDNEIQRREWFAPEECPPEFHQAFMAGFNEEDEAAWMDADKADTGGAGAAEAPEQPKWKGFSDDPDDWFAAQWRDFNAWYEKVPPGFQVSIAHKGVTKAFDDRVAGRRNEAGDWIPPGGLPAQAAGEVNGDEAEDVGPLPREEAPADEKPPVH